MVLVIGYLNQDCGKRIDRLITSVHWHNLFNGK